MIVINRDGAHAIKGKETIARDEGLLPPFHVVTRGMKCGGFIESAHAFLLTGRA
ncbi:hypothetical protein [Gluconacetobacter tumulicola]|uniref:Uncharacterized protein n=1 Tax=Gluconacetobacter tumulicola TaxID=1017177 RepID=A0A7W4JFH8_9PROT|nr:hypothetical protein [Gluconacetobacter tumulicola]MBB2180309.1 hypothetical protein [Gluconacetobacter tumulicola]